MQWYLVSSLLPGFELGGTEVGYFEVEFEGVVPCCGGMARHSAGLHEHRDFGAID